jgi:hypothetical protein
MAVDTRRECMEESISGFKEEGGWVAIVAHGERLTEALAEAGASGEAFEEFEQWRPKAHERFGEDVNAKTAEQMSVEEGEGERAGRTPTEDLESASEELSDSAAELAEGDVDDAVGEGADSVEYVARAVDSAARKAVRTVEGTVYKHVMTQLSPCYFDNELVSANVERTNNGEAEMRYAFEINVNDDDLKERVSSRLAEYDELSRWHVETPKNTDRAEATEGVDPTDSERTRVPRPDGNEGTETGS